jgi:hypothetical protein
MSGLTHATVPFESDRLTEKQATGERRCGAESRGLVEAEGAAPPVSWAGDLFA